MVTQPLAICKTTPLEKPGPQGDYNIKECVSLEQTKCGKYIFLFGIVITFGKHVEIGPEVIFFYCYLINA